MYTVHIHDHPFCAVKNIPQRPDDLFRSDAFTITKIQDPGNTGILYEVQYGFFVQNMNPLFGMVTAG
jgi:hypothetical protein